MPFSRAALDAKDGRGYTVLEAITVGERASTNTYSRPQTFICIDGKTYWVKADVQQGLVAELICGRLAEKANAGPTARIIRVPSEVLPTDGTLAHLEGVLVGSEDRTGTVNARDLQPFIAGGQFSPGLIEPASRALVVVFHTWLGLGDAQVLVDLMTGRVSSIDHGDAFSSLQLPTVFSPVIVPIPGVTSDVGRDVRDVENAVRAIAAVTDGDIMDSVSCIPTGAAWRSPVQRRLEIAEWLGYRRDNLSEVMKQWVR